MSRVVVQYEALATNSSASGVDAAQPWEHHTPWPDEIARLFPDWKIFGNADPDIEKYWK